MDRIGVLLAAVVPALTILAAAVTKARADWRSEALWNAFFLGAVAAIGVVGVTGLAQMLLSAQAAPVGGAWAAGAAKALVNAALPEEIAKFALLVLIAERHVDVRRKQDILPMAVAVALGFAALENLFYLADIADWHSRAVLRALTAVPGHGVDGVVMGAMLTLAQLPSPRRGALAGALILPVVLHAAYDFPLMAKEAGAVGPWPLGLWLVIITASGLLAAVLSTRALALAERADRHAGTERRGVGVALVGATVLGSGIATAVLPIYLGELPWLAVWGMLPIAILPLILGFDLLWWRRRTAAAA